MDVSQIIASVASVPFILALTEIIKRGFRDRYGVDHLPAQALPALDLVLGVVLNVGIAYWQHTDPVLGLFVGLVMGATAAGTYSGAKALRGR